jgi:hypothetical protein
LFLRQHSVQGSKELWRIPAPNKCQFFLWLVLLGRCWTSERLQQHGLRHNDPCALCAQCDETIDHLLVQCVYSREVWFKFVRRFHWSQLGPAADDTFCAWWLRSRKLVQKGRRKTFDSVVALVSWSLWLQRNDRVFKNGSSSPALLVDHLVASMEQWCRAKLMVWSNL